MRTKVIFDTNVLKKEKIDKLKNIQDAFTSGRFSYYLTPILIEEYFDILKKPNLSISSDKISTFSFLENLGNQQIFRHLGGEDGILSMELEGKPKSDYLFYSEEHSNSLRQFIKDCLKGKEKPTQKESQKMQDDDDLWKDRKKSNKTNYVAMRNDVNKNRKSLNLKNKNQNFSSFLEENFEKQAKHLINNNLKSKKSKDELLSYWKQNRESCNYFNKSVEGNLYKSWYSMTTQNKIDKNADEDIAHILYLLDADILISEEKGFLKEACKEIFPDKKCLSVDGFVIS